MIDPNNITTIRVDQLASAVLNVGNEFAHTQGTDLKKATIQDLVDIVSTAVGAGSGVGFLPISVTDGQQLPNVPTDPSFFLCGTGTYLNINGFPDIICTEELNAVMSLSDHWQIAVEIPINSSVVITQTVTEGVTNKAPSENAVFNAINGVDLNKVLTVNNETGGENISISNGDAVILDNGAKLIKGTTNADLGGNKGIALRCSIDYELKWEAGRLYAMEQDGFTIREVSHTFDSTPDNFEDITKGFVIGSRWILDNGVVYVCKDATTATAVWELQIISGGGGGSFSYYLNGSISQGTIGGNAYKEMNSVPVIGTGTDFAISSNGYIAQFLTDVGDPNKLIIPAGNWNFETYFSVNSNGGTPRFYIELYKYDGTTLTLLAENSATPEYITGGTVIDLYFTALSVPYTVLLATDRLAIRFYVINSSKTITMHTENSHLSQVITTFSTGVDSVNGQTGVVVLDTGDISDSTNKRYVTDAQLTVLGNTSGTNTGNQDLSTLQPYAVSTFVAEITFDVPKIFFNFLAPTGATLTSNLTSPLAKKGVVQKIYVNHSTNPVTGLSGWVNIGTGTYTPSVPNIIFAEWTDGTRVEYWIVKA